MLGFTLTRWRQSAFIRAVISEGKDVLAVANRTHQEKELVRRKFPEQYSNRGVSRSRRTADCLRERGLYAENYVRLVGVDVSSGK